MFKEHFIYTYKYCLNKDGEGRDRFRGNQRDRQDSANIDEVFINI